MASDGVNKRHVRKPWYSTACCPSNMARFMPSVPGYMYAHDANDLYVNLFIGGEATITMDRGTVQVAQETNYPWDGNVSITVNPDKSGRFDLLIRIPGWTRNQPVPSDLYRYLQANNEKVRVSVNGKPVAWKTQKGYVRISRKWKAGDQVALNMPMPIRRVVSHERVEDNAGRVAIERGPIVYCAEGVDNGGKALELVLPDTAELTYAHHADQFDGATLIEASAKGGDQVKLIPYYAWAHRGRGEMNVWLKRN